MGAAPRHPSHIGLGGDEYRDFRIDRTPADHHYSCVLLKPFTKGPMAAHTMASPPGHSARILSHLFFVALTVFVGAGLAHGASAYIRVNQVGYVGSSTKRAYLIASAAETGATFAVKNAAGTTVFSASVGTSLGAWGTFTSVYALDFDSVTTAGTYTISVASPIAATSPAFKIDTAANLYATPLANALYYYETSRDGPNYIPNALRTAPGHVKDQSAKVYFTPTFNKKDNAGPLTPTGAIIDASGGWWDAGDYLKFVETHSYTVAMMLVGVRDFPNQLDAGSSSSNYTAEAQFGLDWSQKMWADGTKTLYYQVGVGSGGRAYAAITISGASLRPMTTSQ